MILAYTAGKYRSPDGMRGVEKNIRAAGDVAYELWRLGFAAICPHKNTSFFDGAEIPDEIWLKGCLELLSRADIVVMLPGWEDSVGSRAEREFALSLGKRVFYWEDSGDRIALATLAVTGLDAAATPSREQVLQAENDSFRAIIEQLRLGYSDPEELRLLRDLASKIIRFFGGRLDVKSMSCAANFFSYRYDIRVGDESVYGNVMEITREELERVGHDVSLLWGKFWQRATTGFIERDIKPLLDELVAAQSKTPSLTLDATI